MVNVSLAAISGCKDSVILFEGPVATGRLCHNNKPLIVADFSDNPRILRRHDNLLRAVIAAGLQNAAFYTTFDLARFKPALGRCHIFERQGSLR